MEYIRKHIHAIIGVIIYIITVLLILLLLGFVTPLPLPEEEGILLDFGGSGARDRSTAAPAQQRQETETRTETPATSGVVTQDFEETVAMPSSETPSEAEITEDVPSEEELAAQAIEDARNESADRLSEMMGGAFGSGSAGSESGSGEGHPGMGNGTSGGTGGGPGGIGGSIEGRRLLKRVDPESKENLVGTVVLRIVVDEEGNVHSISLVRTTCSECVELARRAVRQWKYAPSPGAGYQTGNVTINFEPK